VGLTAAIVGYGRRAEEHAAALRDVDGVELRGVVDSSEPRRAAAESELGIPAFTQVEALLDQIGPEIVLVVTPADVRREPVERIAAGASVRAIMVEKPFAHEMADAEAMVEACARNDVLLTVGHQLRFTRPFSALKQAIESGQLGSIEFIRGSCFGHLLDQGPHLIDTVRWITGGLRVNWVMSTGGGALVPGARQGTREGLMREAPAWSTHHLDFEGGVRCTLETGVLHQRSHRFGQRDEIDDYLDKRVTVIGSDGLGEAVAAGDCRILAGDGDWRVHPGGFEAYVAANRAFHEELRDAVLEGSAHRAEARDALDSLEPLLACARSLSEGEAVRLPLPERGAGTVRATMPRAEPEVSVVLPLADHRGFAVDGVRSWTQEQTFDRNRYEVIVGFDGVEAGLEDSVRDLLAPGDRTLHLPGAPEIQLYDQGARSARGKIVIFTEPHCVVEPTYVEEMVEYLRRSGAVGAFGRSVGINGNALARAEEILYEEGVQEWSKPDHWCKVILRGVAFEKRAYLEVGGLDTEYGRFAEFSLAAKFHASGKRLGYAPGAAVRHVYTTSFAMLEPHVIDFINGELDYRLDHRASYCERYFGIPLEWTERKRLSKQGARAAWSLALRALLRPSSWRFRTAPSQLAALWRATPVALFGSAPARASASFSYAVAKFRCRVWRFEDRRLLRAYRDAWDRLGRRTRFRYIAALSPERGASEVEPPFTLADLPDDRLFGFHRQEQSNGTRFRWSSSVAFADVPVDPGEYTVEIDTGGLRGDASAIDLLIFFNGQRVPGERLELDGGRIRFPVNVSSGADQRLGLAVRPFVPSRVADSADDRELGLPVSVLSFARLTDGGG
jgi:predicted dehydrogenase